MKRTIITVIITGLLLQSTFSAFAQTNRGAGNVKVKKSDGKNEEIKLYDASYALLIGESEYTNGWDVLSGVKDDVPAVQAALEKQGFQVKVVMNAKRTELESAINNFIDEYGYKLENRLLIYYAGHGHTVKTGDGRELGYIVPTDAPLPKDEIGFKRKAIPMDDITNYARKIQAKHALFVFDSCFSGKLVSRGEILVTSMILNNVREPVRQFITSGAANQTVPDVSDFRKLFVLALDGAADENRDGFILGSELAVYLKRELTKLSSGRQTPQYDKIPDLELKQGDFVFVLGEPVIDAELLSGTKTAQNQIRQSPTLEVVAAQSIIDRAILAKDGSMQGQVEALESLLARGYDFSNTDLRGISFRGANISQGIFKKAKLSAADLSGTDARNSNFEEIGWRFTNVEKARFNKAALSKIYAPFVWGKDAIFEGADLAETNFFSSDLRGADFSNANLRGVSFAFCDLRGAKFNGADLTGAYFVGAVLDDATFVNAVIKNTEFTGAVAAKFELTPIQKSGACRHYRAYDGSNLGEDFNISLKSTTQGEREQTIEYQHVIFDNFADRTLPLCTSQPLDQFYNAAQDGYQSLILLDNAYVSKAIEKIFMPDDFRNTLNSWRRI